MKVDFNFEGKTLRFEMPAVPRVGESVSFTTGSLGHPLGGRVVGVDYTIVSEHGRLITVYLEEHR